MKQQFYNTYKKTPEDWLQHASWHCLYGSNADGTVRPPEMGDVDAARILDQLRTGELDMIQVYQAFQFGKPVGPPSTRFQEKFPAHVDMLRYDLAFTDPNDFSMVIFPIFTGKHGSTTKEITWGRWRSFTIELRKTEVQYPLIGNSSIPPAQLHNWITYQHPRPSNGPTNYGDFEAVTLAQYMTANNLRLCNRHRSL